MTTDTIAIWHGAIMAEDKHYPRYWRMLDAAGQAHAGNMKNALHQKRYVEAQGRLRQLLAQMLNQAPETLNIKKTEFGKPYLADNPELVFNLSHSGHDLLIATANNCHLGVDLEYCKHRADFPALVNKCFSEEESAYWNALPETQKTTEFYRYWTRKEAFVKAIGRGLALGLKQCAINPEKPSEFLRIPADCGLASKWRVFDIDLGQDVCSALVVDKAINGLSVLDLAL